MAMNDAQKQKTDAIFAEARLLLNADRENRTIESVRRILISTWDGVRRAAWNHADDCDGIDSMELDPEFADLWRGIEQNGVDYDRFEKLGKRVEDADPVFAIGGMVLVFCGNPWRQPICDCFDILSLKELEREAETA
jgi:hypothetical protein